MKKLSILLSFVILCTFGILKAQTHSGAWELSLSGTCGFYSQSYEISGSSYNSSSNSDYRGYISLAFRPGVYIVDGLALEPEFFFLSMKDESPAFNFSGNLSYNFSIPNSNVLTFN